jgi:hypothetical protein
MKETSKVHKIAFVGDHLPRKCGIATFTTDLLDAVASAHPQSECLAVSVNDIPGGYDYRRSGTRAKLDQQPIEAHATLSACLDAYRATADIWRYEKAQCAFDWFTGWNDLGVELYSPETGGCRDGLHVDRTNRNQGAESTLAFLLSLSEMQLAQNTLTTFKKPIALEV